MNNKYIEGHYYKRVKINKINSYIARDIWDKERKI